MTHNLSRAEVSKYNFVVVVAHSVNMLNLTLKELKAVAKFRGIKVYESLSEDELLDALNLSKINFAEPRIENIRKNLMNQSINFLN